MYHENRLFFPSELQINQSISPLFDRSPLHSTSSFFTPLLMLLIHLSKLQISQKILLDHVGEISKLKMKNENPNITEKKV